MKIQDILKLIIYCFQTSFPRQANGNLSNGALKNFSVNSDENERGVPIQLIRLATFINNEVGQRELPKIDEKVDGIIDKSDDKKTDDEKIDKLVKPLPESTKTIRDTPAQNKNQLEIENLKKQVCSLKELKNIDEDTKKSLEERLMTIRNMN